MFLVENQLNKSLGEEYQDPYGMRIRQALYSRPIYPILFNESMGLSPDYTLALQYVDNVTQQNGICDHGWGHITQVTRNAMMLTDVARNANPTPGTMEDLAEAEILSDSMIMFTAMHSDLAYGHHNANVNGRSVFDHGQRSTQLIDAYRVLKPTLENIDSAHLIRNNTPAIKEALSIDMDQATSFAAQIYMQNDPVTPQQIFVIIQKLADVFDYYRASRVDRINESDQQDNPYFHLAKKVSEYELVYDGALKYRARMDPYHIGISQSGSQMVTFSDWYKASRVTVEADRKDYDQVWQLADLFCAIVGTNFKVEELV